MAFSSSPVCSTAAARRTQGFTAGECFRSVGLSGTYVLAGGMIAAAPRVAMESWHLWVSKAPFVVTLAIS